jgi:hypothetical protein
MKGLRFGRLVVEELACIAPRCWKCLCDCGKVTIVEGGNLRRKGNGTRSCGRCESPAELPLDPAFVEVLEEWKAKAPASEAGWVFASYEGKPFHAAPIQQDYFRPAGHAIGLKGELGWHTFRHSYRSMLDASGAPVGVQQKLMRDAQVSTTMNVYGSAYMEGKRVGPRQGSADGSLRTKAKGHRSNGGLITAIPLRLLGVGIG